MQDRFKFRIPMFTDKGSFMEFQYLELGEQEECTLCGYNGEPQQCTGLKDNNGKLIYIGDVVKDDATNSIFKVGEKKCAIYLENNEYIGYFHKLSMDFAKKRLETIGNIYQNPELLED